VSPSSLVLAAGSSDVIDVTFTPIQGSSPTSSLEIITDNLEQGSLTVDLIAPTQTSMEVTPNQLDFGSVGVGRRIEGILTIRNTGNARIQGTVELSGQSKEEATFTIFPPNFDLSPGESQEIAIEVKVDVEGTLRAQFKVASHADTITVDAKVVVEDDGPGGPRISVSPLPLDFGTVQIDAPPSTLPLRIQNVGTGTLRIDNISSNATAFVLQNASDRIFGLTENEVKLVQITFTPAGRGRISGILTIQSNEQTNPNFQAVVQAEVVGTPGPIFNALTAPVDFGQVGFGEESDFELIVKNTGVAPGQIFGVRPDNNQIRATSQIPVTVQPDNTVAIVLTYIPLPYRAREGSITLFTEDEQQLRISVGWSATEVPVTALGVSPLFPRHGELSVGSNPEVSVRFTEEILTIGRNFVAADLQIHPRPLNQDWRESWDVSTDGRTVSFSDVQLKSDGVYRLTVSSAISRDGHELLDPVQIVFSTGNISVEEVGVVSGVVRLSKIINLPGGNALVDTTEDVVGRVFAVGSDNLIAAETRLGECGAYELEGLPPDDYRLYVEVAGQDAPISIGIDQNSDGRPDEISVAARDTIDAYDVVVEDIVVTEDASGTVSFDGDSSPGDQDQDTASFGEDDRVTIALYADGVEDLTRFESIIEYNSEELQFVDFQMLSDGADVSLLTTSSADQAFVASKAPVVEYQGSQVSVNNDQIRIGGKILDGRKQNAVSGGGLFGLISFIKTGSAKLAKPTTLQTNASSIKLKEITLYSVGRKRTIELAAEIQIKDGGGQSGGDGALVPSAGDGSWSVDLNAAKGDQGVRQLTVGAGGTFTLELINNQSVSPSLGGSFHIKFDTEKLEPDLGSVTGITSLLGQPEVEDGVLTFTFGGLSGVPVDQGHVGQVSFSVIDGFDSDTELVLLKAEIGDATTFGNLVSEPGSSVVIHISVGGPAPTPDLDGDGQVGFRDFIQFAQAFGAETGEEKYLPSADLDSNGEIAFRDFVLFAQSYGKPASEFVAP
jgi:hypothetical protein